MTVLVTGASGHVGGELLGQLAASGGHAVRAMTRRPDDLRAPAGVDVRRGDADDPASLDGAFAGVDRAFLMSAQAIGSVPAPTHVPALVAAAQRAGVRHVVLLSSYDGGAGPSGHDPIAAWTRASEDAVRALPATVLRPGRFLSNALAWAPQVRRGDAITIPFAHRPAASIDPADVAAVAARALTDDPPRDVVAHRLSGPQVLTPAEELAAIAAEIDRPLHVVEPPLEQVRGWMTAGGMPPEVVDAVVARTLDGDEGTTVLPTVDDLLGRPARTAAQWAAAHRAAFTG